MSTITESSNSSTTTETPSQSLFVDNIDISDYYIYLICNHDVVLTSLIVCSLKKRRANNVFLLVPSSNLEFQQANLGVPVIPGRWSGIEDFSSFISSETIIVISMLYHDIDTQYKLFQACVRQQVPLFITWDSGMELEHHVNNRSCPRTRLHQMLLDYDYDMKRLCYKQETNWILFQVGVFDVETIHFDLSTVTSSFNSPNQFIFLNVTVKEDLASLIVNSIVNPRLEPNRNYVVGEFVAHTFLGHIYQVFNKGVRFDINLPADISEFDTSNQLRLSGIISARPLPQIIFPENNLHINKLAMELSLQYGANIYKILSDHKRHSLKQWVYNKILSQNSS